MILGPISQGLKYSAVIQFFFHDVAYLFIS